MDYRFLTFLLTTAFLEQTVVSVARITTSYRAVEVGLSVVWIGVISAAFAVLPLILVVATGRYIDKGHDARTAWIGSGLLVLACAGFVLGTSLVWLLIATAILGTGHMVMVISQQVLCARQGGPGGLERVLGNYMVANAVGQGVGPYIVGWAGGAASIPPTHFLFVIALVAAVVCCVSSFMLRPDPGATVRWRERASKPIPVMDILRLPGLNTVLFVSVITVVAQDLMVVYLPLLGAERGMPVGDVGQLLTVRALASMLSRFLFARLNLWFGRTPLMIGSTLASGFTYAAVALPLPMWGMHIAIAGSGFALSISITAAIATLLTVTSAETLGTANALRMMGNRIGQFTIPFLAGLIAAATGVGGIFLILGLSLAAAGTSVRIRRPA
jgi:MFS family permease